MLSKLTSRTRILVSEILKVPRRHLKHIRTNGGKLFNDTFCSSCLREILLWFGSWQAVWACTDKHRPKQVAIIIK